MESLAAALRKIQHGATVDRVTAGCTMMFELSPILISLTPLTLCRLPWHFIAWCGLGFRRDLLQVSFAAVRDSLDVAAPGDCSSAIKPKVSAVCPSAITWAPGASPSRCSSSISYCRRRVDLLGVHRAHYLDQLFGVRALAHRGLLPFIGGLCGDHFPAPHHHDPNETLPNFPKWVMVGSSSTDWSCSSRASPSSLSFVARSQLVLGLRLMALVASCVLVSVEYMYAPMEGMFRYREVQGSHVRDRVYKMSEIVASTATQPIRLGGGYTVALAPHFQGPRPKDRGSVGSTLVCRWPPGGVSGALRPPQSPQDWGRRL